MREQTSRRSTNLSIARSRPLDPLVAATTRRALARARCAYVPPAPPLANDPGRAAGSPTAATARSPSWRRRSCGDGVWALPAPPSAASIRTARSALLRRAPRLPAPPQCAPPCAGHPRLATHDPLRGVRPFRLHDSPDGIGPRHPPRVVPARRSGLHTDADHRWPRRRYRRARRAARRRPLTRSRRGRASRISGARLRDPHPRSLEWLAAADEEGRRRAGCAPCSPAPRGRRG